MYKVSKEEDGLFEHREKNIYIDKCSALTLPLMLKVANLIMVNTTNTKRCIILLPSNYQPFQLLL